LEESTGAEPNRIRKVEGSIMQNLNGDVESRLIETPLLPTPAVLLAGILALSIASAVLALLAT
jgi:hypothetical protein